MTNRFGFGWTDIFIAPTRGLSLRYITILTFSLAIALRLVSYFGQLGASISDVSWGTVADASGWLPIHLSSLSLISKIIVFIGWWVGSLIVMTGMTAVSISELEKLKGNPFARIDQVVGAAWNRIRVVIVHDLLVWGVLLVMFLLCMSTGLPALIPGEILPSILYGILLLPALILAVLLLFVIVVWLIGRLAIPSIAACESSPTSFVLTVELFSAVMRQPYRWFGSFAYALVSGKLVSLFYGWFLFVAGTGLIQLGSVLAGDQLLRSCQTALERLPLDSSAFEILITGFPRWLSVPLDSVSRSWGSDGGTRFLANILLFLLLSIAGYWLSVVTVSLVRGMVVIRRSKDNRDLTQEAPYFGRDEHINPPLAGITTAGSTQSPATDAE